MKQYCILTILLSMTAVSVFASDLLRPQTVDSGTKGIEITKPGDYKVSIGDAFEISYSFPIIPSTFPKEVDVTVGESDDERNVFSVIGPLNVVRPNVVGGGEIVVLLVAKKAISSVKARFVVDGTEYVYALSVVANEAKK